MYTHISASRRTVFVGATDDDLESRINVLQRFPQETAMLLHSRPRYARIEVFEMLDTNALLVRYASLLQHLVQRRLPGAGPFTILSKPSTIDLHERPQNLIVGLGSRIVQSAKTIRESYLLDLAGESFADLR